MAQLKAIELYQRCDDEKIIANGETLQLYGQYRAKRLYTQKKTKRRCRDYPKREYVCH